MSRHVACLALFTFSFATVHGIILRGAPKAPKVISPPRFTKSDPSEMITLTATSADETTNRLCNQKVGRTPKKKFFMFSELSTSLTSLSEQSLTTGASLPKKDDRGKISASRSGTQPIILADYSDTAIATAVVTPEKLKISSDGSYEVIRLGAKTLMGAKPMDADFNKLLSHKTTSFNGNIFVIIHGNSKGHLSIDGTDVTAALAEALHTHVLSKTHPSGGGTFKDKLDKIVLMTCHSGLATRHRWEVDITAAQRFYNKLSELGSAPKGGVYGAMGRVINDPVRVCKYRYANTAGKSNDPYRLVTNGVMQAPGTQFTTWPKISYYKMQTASGAWTPLTQMLAVKGVVKQSSPQNLGDFIASPGLTTPAGLWSHVTATKVVPSKPKDEKEDPILESEPPSSSGGALGGASSGGGDSNGLKLDNLSSEEEKNQLC